VLDFERQPTRFLECRENYLAERFNKTDKKLVTEWDYERKGFDDEVMKGLPRDNNVQKIKMNWNNFTRADFISSKSLIELELCHNKIRSLQINSSYPSLTRLVLIDNQLEVLDFTMLNLPSLDILDLGTPNLTQITIEYAKS
jgi:Leucine-rich repeat (LRR) protein